MVFANNNILQIPTEFGIHILIEHIPPRPPPQLTCVERASLKLRSF